MANRPTLLIKWMAVPWTGWRSLDRPTGSPERIRFRWQSIQCEEELQSAPSPSHVGVSEASVLIAGTARDCASALERSIQALENATAGFRQRQVLIVESDSIDGTPKMLARFADEGRIVSDCLGPLSSRFPLRTQRIAHCRQRIQDHVRSAAGRIDYVILADMDGVNSSLTRAGLESGWSLSEPWDVLTANQAGKYYDIWALRHPYWSPDDCWETARQLAPLFGARAANDLAVSARQRRLDRRAAPVEVESAFGGLAIYRTAAFLAGRYEGLTDDGREVCEHVPFHAELRSKGFRIFINPMMLNTSPLAHTSGHAMQRLASFARELRLKWASTLGNTLFK